MRCAVCGGARSVPASLPLALTVADHVTPSRTVICARTACQADGFAGSTAGALFGSIQKTAPLSASNKRKACVSTLPNALCFQCCSLWLSGACGKVIVLPYGTARREKFREEKKTERQRDKETERQRER